MLTWKFIAKYETARIILRIENSSHVDNKPQRQWTILEFNTHKCITET